MAEGDSVTAKVDALAKSIDAADKSAEFFKAALSQMSTALAAAKAASADADAALAAGNAQYAELETNALRAAKALERANAKGFVPLDVKKQAEETKAALDAYTGQLAALEVTAKNARTSQDALAISLAATRDKAKAAEDAEAALSAAEKQAAKDAADAAAKQEAALRAPHDAAKAAAKEIGDFRGSIGTLPGPLGKLANAALAPAQGFQKLQAAFGASRAMSVLAVAGIAAVAVAVVALTAALAAGVVKIAAWAVELGDATRSAQIASEAFAVMNPELADLPFAAVAKETQLATGELQGLAKQLQAAGVAAADMPEALRAAAMAQKLLGAGAVQDFVDQLKAAPDAVREISDESTSKLAGLMARQLQGLDAQTERLHQNIGGLFGSLDIDPALEGLGKMVDLFDQNTAAGEALQILFKSIFQPIIDAASTAFTAVEAFYLGVMIGAMKLYIAIKPTIKAFKEFFGLDAFGLEFSFETITDLGEQLAPVLIAIAAVLGGALAIAFGTIAAIVAVQIGIWYGLVKAVKAVVAVFEFLAITVPKYVAGAIADVVKYLTGVDLRSIGSNMIAGLVAGIKNAAGAVISAITGVVGSAIAAASNLLRIGSPSKVFEDIGQYTGEGFAGGIEDTTDAAHGAIASMVSPTEAMDQAAMSGDVAALERLQGLDAAAAPAAAAAAPAGAPAAAAAAGSSKTVTLYNPVINLGAGTAKEQAQEFVTWITELLEGDAAQAAGA